MTNEIIEINTAEIRSRKKALESKMRELLGSAREREGLQIEYAADPLDQVRSNTDREMTVRRLDQQARLIHEIQSAVAKINEGAYGLCEDCEEAILRKRLDAVPWARLCVTCQSKAEAAEQVDQFTFKDVA